MIICLRSSSKQIIYSLPRFRVREQSKPWIPPGKRAPKKEKNYFIGWKSHGHNFLGFKWYNIHLLLGKSKTITGRYYVMLLDQFHGEFMENS